MPTEEIRPCGCGGVSQRMLKPGEKDAGGINGRCHGFLGGLDPHKGNVMPNPKIVAVYWDQYFTDTAAAVTTMNQLLSDLCSGGYWAALGQYLVGQASFQGSVVIDMKKYPTPNTGSPGKAFSESQMQAQLVKWLDDGVVTPKPAGNEVNLVYLIFAPTDTTLSLAGSTGGFCAYHQHGKYNASGSRDNLIWATVQGYTTSKVAQTFADSISYCVSHELTESFTNPEGNGYYNQSNGCEIGDICEAGTTGGIITVPYKTWQVEQYWSNMDAKCLIGAEKRWAFAGNTAGFGNLQDGRHGIWQGDFTGAGHQEILFYYNGDGNWWLGNDVGGRLNFSLVNSSPGFGNLLDGKHAIWIGDFTGAGHQQVLSYYNGDGNWWLGDIEQGRLNWTLVNSSPGFGNLLDGSHRIWIGDFSGAGHLQVLFYYSGDGNWWLGNIARGSLGWTLVNSSPGFGNLLDGKHAFYLGDFGHVGHLQVLFYYSGDGHWWLGNVAGGKLGWTLVNSSPGFGNLLDGRHATWIGDFSGSGHAQVMFYFNGDGHWWLGDVAGGTLGWTLVNSSPGFGNLLDGKHGFYVGDFTGAGRTQVLFYYNGDGNWWLSNMINANSMGWLLVNSSPGFGNLLDGSHKIWLGDFLGVGHLQVLFYYNGDGHWWLGNTVNGALSWTQMSQSLGFGNLLDGKHPVWIGDFNGARHAEVLFQYTADGNWWLGDMTA